MKAMDRVTIAQGKIEGELHDNGTVASFKGIPYARAPIGALRWREPQPPESWDGVRSAKQYGAIAPQPIPFPKSLYYLGTEPQSEDCLFLNVWTPAQSTNEKLPVMVWFHLGAFQFGAGSQEIFDGRALAHSGAILVTVNYRIGRLGFLAHPFLSAESKQGTSGNYGLLDQIASLKWVQENIAAFGGDPDCVTIFGVSAGGYSCSFLMSSPLAKGLFHRVIGESGGGFAPLADSSDIGDLMQDLEHAERTNTYLSEQWGVSSAEEMRLLSIEQLNSVPLPLTMEKWVMPALGGGYPRGIFDSTYPILDGYLLPQTPYDIFSAGRQNNVPLMTGSAAREATGMPFIEKAADFIADAKAAYGDMADEFLRVYSVSNDAETYENSGASAGDRLFVYQNWTWARLHSKTSLLPVYYYHWKRVPPVPKPSPYCEETPGAFHSAECLYVFGTQYVRPWNWEDIDRELAEKVRGLWVNFAKTGNPNGVAGVNWTQFNANEPKVLHIGESIVMGEVPHLDRLNFLDKFYAAMRL